MSNRIGWRAYVGAAEAICTLAEARPPGDEERDVLTEVAFNVATRAAGAWMPNARDFEPYTEAWERITARIVALTRDVEQWRRDKSRERS